GRPALDPLVLSFQLKLLWLAGYLPHLTSCVECGTATALVAYSARAGGAVCRAPAGGGIALAPGGRAGSGRLRAPPPAAAAGAVRGARARRDALSVVTS